MHAMLRYDRPCEEKGPVNLARRAIMDYIEKHRGMLSLPCDGNCFAHNDGTVLSCYKELVEELNAQTDEEAPEGASERGASEDSSDRDGDPDEAGLQL